MTLVDYLMPNSHHIKVRIPYLRDADFMYIYPIMQYIIMFQKKSDDKWSIRVILKVIVL